MPMVVRGLTITVPSLIVTWLAYHMQRAKDPTALLWQKEASDIPSKSELLMFSYFT